MKRFFKNTILSMSGFFMAILLTILGLVLANGLAKSTGVEDTVAKQQTQQKMDIVDGGLTSREVEQLKTIEMLGKQIAELTASLNKCKQNMKQLEYKLKQSKYSQCSKKKKHKKKFHKKRKMTHVNKSIN